MRSFLLALYQTIQEIKLVQIAVRFDPTEKNLVYYDDDISWSATFSLIILYASKFNVSFLTYYLINRREILWELRDLMKVIETMNHTLI